MTFSFSRLSLFSLASLALFAMPACTPLGVATGAGATVGVAASQEGGLRRAVSDARIQTEINDLWFKYDLKTFAKLDLTINQGRVLVTGVVQDPEARVEAIRLAWQPEGVLQVINEVQVAESTGFVGFARDVWVTTRLRTELTLDKYVQSINYSIDTVQGTIYLMGIAQDQAELNRVIERARTIPDVKRVVSYVRMRPQAVASEPGVVGDDAFHDTSSAANERNFDTYGYDAADYQRPAPVEGAEERTVKRAVSGAPTTDAGARPQYITQ